MKDGMEVPRLLLGLRSLAGASRVTRDRQLEVVARYREPESLAVLMSKSLDAGAQGVLVAPSPPLRAALAELKRAVPLYLVIPALGEYERPVAEPRIEALIEKSLQRAGPGTRMRVGFSSMLKPSIRFEGDLAVRLPLLIEAESAGLKPKGVILDAWLTDLALAAGNKRFFERYVKSVRRRFRAAAGLETHNLGTLLARLREWQVEPDLVIGPLNPAGLMMKPTPEEALAEVARGGIRVIAQDLRAGGIVSLAESAGHARTHGAYGLAPDLAEMDDVGQELKALARGMAVPRD